MPRWVASLAQQWAAGAARWSWRLVTFAGSRDLLTAVGTAAHRVASEPLATADHIAGDGAPFCRYSQLGFAHSIEPEPGNVAGSVGPVRAG